jgi:hypothetical protein
LIIASVAASAGEYLRYTDLGIGPVALDIGFFQVKWYSLGYLFGILLGYWLLLKLIRKPGSPMSRQHADAQIGIAKILACRRGDRCNYQDISPLGFASLYSHIGGIKKNKGESDMPTALDQAIDATVARLMENDGPLSVTHAEKFGQQLPMLAKAPTNLRDYFQMFCALNADKEFLVDGDIRLTFAESHSAARALAGGLVQGHGLQVGDRVGIAARNSANWIIAYMAVIMAGGVATLLNGWWQGGELAEGIRMVGCRYVLTDAQRAARLEGEDIGGAELLMFEHDKLPLEGLSVLIEKGGDANTELSALDPLDAATILYTSGSTGQSKGAWSDHRAVVQGAMSYVGQTLVFFELMSASGQAMPAQPSALVNVPLFHVTGCHAQFLASFAYQRKGCLACALVLTQQVHIAHTAPVGALV